jgi:hypothetical protein
MKPEEIELWAIEVVNAVLASQPVEDSRVELKSSWPEPRKAADRLAAHANAARGTGILWLIGVDEGNHTINPIDFVELSNWCSSLERFFDGFPPRLAISVAIRTESGPIVALFFETTPGAPFVVTSSQGGYPDFIVPWREGTRLRAARREDLLRILVPIRRISALTDELDFNIAVARSTPLIASLGASFRTDEFHHALADGLLGSLPVDIKDAVTEAYVSMERVNALVAGALNSSLGPEGRGQQNNKAWEAMRDCTRVIEKAYAALTRIK